MAAVSCDAQSPADPAAAPATSHERTQDSERGPATQAATTTPPTPPEGCALVTCTATLGTLELGTSPAHEFSVDASTIYERGRATRFDAQSFRFHRAPECSLWGDVYVTDRRDVYVSSPQSCGGANCGDDYTGFYWQPLQVGDPNTFVVMPGGYGRDKLGVYYRWAQPRALVGADAPSFRVFWCVDPRKPTHGEFLALDKVRFYLEGEAVPADRVRDRWRR